MWRTRLAAWSAAVLVAVGGCASGPLLENPLLIRSEPCAEVENPVYVPLGPPAYGLVFENVLDILRGGIDSALMGLGRSSIHDLVPEDILVPEGFTRALGV